MKAAIIVALVWLAVTVPLNFAVSAWTESAFEDEDTGYLVLLMSMFVWGCVTGPICLHAWDGLNDWFKYRRPVKR